MARLRIDRAGLLTSVQDDGRYALRKLGIPWSGTLCPAWQQIGNALVGNSPDAPVLEIFEGGLALTALDAPITIAVIASADAKLRICRNDDNCSSFAALRSINIPAGGSVFVDSTGAQRIAVLAIKGAALEKQLGSYSTYAKASLGGLNGKVLAAQDSIPVLGPIIDPAINPDLDVHPDTERIVELPESLLYQRSELRVVMGPQDDHFSAAGIDNFLTTAFTLTSDADRMGVRLQGAAVEHLDNSSKDIVSDAIFPGSIQIPGTGQPIVLLNDAHTAGGYPKIATVISVDLPLLGLSRPGTRLQFRSISIEKAIAIKRQLHNEIQRCILSVEEFSQPSMDSEVLLQYNLIDGVWATRDNGQDTVSKHATES